LDEDDMLCCMYSTVFRLYGHLNINKQLAGLSKVTEK